MSDPIARLRQFDPGPLDGAPTPAEIRRRGDQLRRRRRTTTVAAVALVVAAIVVPVALLDPEEQATLPVPPATAPTTASDPTISPTPSAPAVPSGSPTVPTTIPTTFPLTTGWPDSSEAEPGPNSGVTGPQVDLEDPLFDYQACGQRLPVPEAADRLRATYRDVEDSRSRQLLVFTDAQEAVVFMSDLVAFYRACPDDPGQPQGAAFARTVIDTEVGGGSYAAGAFPPDGQPVGSTQVLHAVRVGSAVLLDTTEGEGGGGDLDALTRGRAELMTSRSTDPVAAMCRFTVAGC